MHNIRLCVHIYIYIYMYIYIYTEFCTYTSPGPGRRGRSSWSPRTSPCARPRSPRPSGSCRIDLSIYPSIGIPTCIYIYIYICIYKHIHLHLYIPMHTYTYLYLYNYTSIYRQSLQDLVERRGLRLARRQHVLHSEDEAVLT